MNATRIGLTIDGPLQLTTTSRILTASLTPARRTALYTGPAVWRELEDARLEHA